jgi:hypothetical protein
VRSALALIGCSALLLAPAASAKTAGPGRARVALSVSPAQIALARPGSSRIRVRNDGSGRVVVDVARRSVDASTTAKAWLQVVPARLVLRSGASATLTVRVKRPQRAEPGEHQALVLLETRALRSGHVNLQLRLGVRIGMRVPGRVVRQIAFGSLRVQRDRHAWRMLLAVANRGNVTLQLHSKITAWLVRRGNRVARLRPRVRRRPLPPGSRTVLALGYSGRLRGPVTALVRARLGPGTRVVERRYRLRL